MGELPENQVEWGVATVLRQNKAVTSNILDRVSFNEAGLVPAIAQDSHSGAVLMLAWMNRESLGLTLQTRKATYWSRSRNELWVKGETSGHAQAVDEIRLDCDGDTVLLKVTQIGGACHTGELTCFDADLLVGDTL